MIGCRLWILTLAGAFACPSTSAGSTKSPAFDGSWTLVAQTTEVARETVSPLRASRFPSTWPKAYGRSDGYPLI
jgi:hypothetical protein